MSTLATSALRRLSFGAHFLPAVPRVTVFLAEVEAAVIAVRWIGERQQVAAVLITTA